MERTLKNKKTLSFASVRYFQGLNYLILATVLVSNICFQLSEVSTSAFKYLGIICSMVPLFFIDKDDYIYVFISYLSVIRVSTIFGVAAINLVTFVYFFRAYIFDERYHFQKERRLLSRNLIVACVVLILYSLQYMFADSGEIKTLLENIKLMFFLVFMVDAFRSCESEEKLYKKFMNMQVYCIVGVFISVVSSLLINPNYALKQERLAVAEASGTNQLGILLAFCIVYLLFAVMRVKNISEIAVIGCVLFVFTYYCFATQSRTAIVGILAALVCIVIWGLTHSKTAVPIAVMIAVLLLFLYLVCTYGKDTVIYENIMMTVERFVNPKKGDISNGRLYLWKTYLNAIFTDARLFLLGGQSSAYPDLVAHNIFIEILADYGFIGFGIVAWIYVVVFKEIKNSVTRFGKRKVKLISLLPFALVFIMGMASHTLTGTVPTVTFCLGTAMIYLYGYDKPQTEQSDEEKTFGKAKRFKPLRGKTFKA